jgi:hypothetical protein
VDRPGSSGRAREIKALQHNALTPLTRLLDLDQLGAEVSELHRAIGL